MPAGAVNRTSTIPPTGAKAVPAAAVIVNGVPASMFMFCGANPPGAAAICGALKVTVEAAPVPVQFPSWKIARTVAVAVAAPQIVTAGVVPVIVVAEVIVPARSIVVAVPPEKIGVAAVQRSVTGGGRIGNGKSVPVIVIAVGVSEGTGVG